MGINLNLKQEVINLFNNLFCEQIEQSENNVSKEVIEYIFAIFMCMHNLDLNRALNEQECFDNIKDENKKLSICKKILEGEKVHIPGLGYEFCLWGVFYEWDTGKKININSNKNHIPLQTKLKLQSDEVIIGRVIYEQWEIYNDKKTQHFEYHERDLTPDFMVLEYQDERKNKLSYGLARFRYLTDKIESDGNITSQFEITAYGDLQIQNPQIEKKGKYGVIKLEGEALKTYKNVQSFNS